MKKLKFVLAGIIALGIGAAAGFLKKYIIRNPKKQKTGKLEDQFQAEWTTVLLTDAKLYNGLFAGIDRVSHKTAKNPEQILKEWNSRTAYKWEDSPITELCQKTLVPAIESKDSQLCVKWAELILKAAQEAGITKETAAELELNETTISAYVEWDGEELYIGDRVKVLHPAWYQKEQIIEQGHCNLISNKE